jgi:hypothetical protein
MHRQPETAGGAFFLVSSTVSDRKKEIIVMNQ